MTDNIKCPVCGSSTRLRIARKDGGKFHVCDRYPECKGRVEQDQEWDSDSWDEKPSSTDSVQVNKSGEQLIPNANCPYCNVILESAPKRKKKCLSCGKDIYVRTDPFNKQITYYLNQEDALSLDMIKHLQISENEFREVKERTRDNQHLSDCVWGLLNKKKQNLARKGDWQSMSRITEEQARMQYTLGKSYFHLLQEAMREQLQGQSHYITRVQVIACKDDRTCKKCASLDGKIFTIKEALEKMPLPVECDNDEGWCRCAYGYHGR